MRGTRPSTPQVPAKNCFSKCFFCVFADEAGLCCKFIGPAPQRGRATKRGLAMRATQRRARRRWGGRRTRRKPRSQSGAWQTQGGGSQSVALQEPASPRCVVPPNADKWNEHIAQGAESSPSEPPPPKLTSQTRGQASSKIFRNAHVNHGARYFRALVRKRVLQCCEGGVGFWTPPRSSHVSAVSIGVALTIQVFCLCLTSLVRL